MSTEIAPESTMQMPSASASDAPPDSMLLGGRKISEEDRAEILQSIEQVAALNRIPAGPSLFQFKALKKGFVFPLVINLLAALAVAGGVVGSNIYFSRKQATISSQAGTYFSAEGLIVAQVRKQSEQKLKAKDEEIATVKAELSRLDRESTALRANMQATLQAKQQELKRQMESQLAAEKARLQSLGISSAEVANRLAAFERQKNSQFSGELAAYRRQNEVALQTKEQQIQAQQQKNQLLLDQASHERSQLLQQLAQQESQLRAEYEAQAKKLESSNQQLAARTTAAEAKLQALAAQSQNEQLVSDQIVGSYGSILQDIRQARYNAAGKGIASLTALLDSPRIDSLPNITRRKPVDLEILASLRELIKARTQPGQPLVDPAILGRADQVSAAEKLAGEAEAAQKNGNTVGAKELYTKAIAAVPAAERAFSSLMSLFDRSQSELAARNEGQIASLQSESARKSAEIDRLTRRLADTEGALRNALSSAAALRKQVADQNARIASLGQELSTNGGAAGRLEEQLAAERRSGAAYQKELAAQRASAESYRQELTAAGARAASLKEQLAGAEGRVNALQGQLAAAQVRMDGLESASARFDTAVASVQGSYASFKNELTGLVSSGAPQDLQKAQKLLLAFVDNSGVDSLLPGFSSVAGKVVGAQAGLAERSTPAAGGSSPAVQYRLIGTVSFVSPNTVTVEKLVNIAIPTGSKVVIRRRNAHGAEVPVAEGTVTSLSSDGVEVTLTTPLDGGFPPQTVDVAYLEQSSGT